MSDNTDTKNKEVKFNFKRVEQKAEKLYLICPTCQINELLTVGTDQGRFVNKCTSDVCGSVFGMAVQSPQIIFENKDGSKCSEEILAEKLNKASKSGLIIPG